MTRGMQTLCMGTDTESRHDHQQHHRMRGVVVATIILGASESMATDSKDSTPTCHAVLYATTLLASTHPHATQEYVDTERQ